MVKSSSVGAPEPEKLQKKNKVGHPVDDPGMVLRKTVNDRQKYA